MLKELKTLSVASKDVFERSTTGSCTFTLASRSIQEIQLIEMRHSKSAVWLCGAFACI